MTNRWGLMLAAALALLLVNAGTGSAFIVVGLGGYPYGGVGYGGYPLAGYGDYPMAGYGATSGVARVSRVRILLLPALGPPRSRTCPAPCRGIL